MRGALQGSGKTWRAAAPRHDSRIGGATESMTDTQALTSLAEELRDALAAAPLDLDSPGTDTARLVRGQAVRQLDDYVVPRLRDVDAPVLAVVGGSTGAGKSTLVNTLVGTVVTAAGVLRPTTRSPVLIHRAEDQRWFDGARVLPRLARVRGGAPTGHTQIQMVVAATLPNDLAVVDAPDIDSVVDANRELATELLDAADLWVFVTTAARYADAVPWGFLRRARSRGVGIGLVLNRVPPGATGQILPHLTEMLGAEGLGGAPVFAIDEQPLTADGLLPAASVGGLRSWLADLVADKDRRAQLVRTTLVGTVDELARQSDTVADHVDHQVAMRQWLADRVDDAFRGAGQRLGAEIADGSVMRGEVLARWHELVGTGELLRQLQSRIGRLRDKLASVFTGRETGTDQFHGAVTSGLETMVTEDVAQAIDDVVAHWRSVPAGQQLLVGTDTSHIVKPSTDLPERVSRMVRDWQGELLETLKREGAGKRNAARAMSYGVNGLALVTMVGVFAATGGLTGAEVAIAGGSSAVSQKLLEAMFGDQAVRTMATTARDDLQRRFRELLTEEADRFRRLLEANRVPADTGSRLRRLAAELSDGTRRGLPVGGSPAAREA